MNEKPVVYFLGNPLFYAIELKDGTPTWQATVYGLDHPRLGEGPIRTTALVSKPDSEQFETLNTIYRRKD